MHYYFAPLEGITGSVFRRTYDRFFGGIDAYYTPFVTTRDGGIMKKKELRDILPENNPGLNIVPQIMTTKADEFVCAASHMEQLGYTEVNLNLGCPSNTVVPKGKGSAFLREPEKLDVFLENIFNKCPIGISIKSRIGFKSAEELPRLLDIYKKYPVRLLTLHLRTREEWYQPGVHPEAFALAEEALSDTNIPLCYNGDIKTKEDVEQLIKSFPGSDHVMIGRGYLAHPGFIGNESLYPDNDRGRILEFVRGLQAEYEEVLFGETPVLFKMKELWGYMQESFPDKKLFKAIKKTKHLRDYEVILDGLEQEVKI